MAAPASFADPAPNPEVDYPKPERLIAGNPKRTTWNRYEDRGVFMGEWACEVGHWKIAFGPHKHEFFHVLSGRCRIADADGHAREYGPGDAGVIPAGFAGSFEVLEAVRKRYVIVDRAA